MTRISSNDTAAHFDNRSESEVYGKVSSSGCARGGLTFFGDQRIQAFLVLESIKSALTFVEQSRKLKFNKHD